MKVKILDKGEQYVTFVMEEINPSFANALRRAMIGEVPTLAVDEVDVHFNDSAMYSEVIAHRLGLIPLTFDSKGISIKDECTCEGEGCVQCEVVFVLKKEGPCTVYAKDMKSNNEDVKPLYGEIPIALLTPGQRLELECTARLGRGKEHAKWQASISSYKYYPNVTIKSGISEEDSKKIMDVCPTNVFERSGRGAKVANETACILCDACVEASDFVDVKGDDTKFIFNVESVSGLAPEDIVSKALEILETKAKSFGDKIATYN